MPQSTSRLALVTPLLSESADGPDGFRDLALQLDILVDYRKSTIASRPSNPGHESVLHWATDTHKLSWYDGAAWWDIGPTALGADSVTAAMIQAAAVGTSEIADGSVTTAKIALLAITNGLLAAGAVDAAKIAAALKPSGGAAGGTEALRALGTTAGTALAGDAAVAQAVVSAYSASRTNGQTYTITAPTTGTYIIEWGCGTLVTSGSGSTAGITCSAVSGRASYDYANTGGNVVRGGVALTAAQVVTFTVAGTGFFTSLDHCWAKLTRTA